MSLPATGASNWGVPLNNYITNVVLAEANTAQSAITTHQTAADPHGDRAYALTIFSPITTGVNGPNGFVQLNSIGKLPNSILPAGGGRTSTFDVVKDYSAPTNGVSDASTAIQNALNDCNTSGGGEVWVGDGTFAIGETLFIGSNTWLHLSPGATMKRIIGTSGQAPKYMLANFNGSVSAAGSNQLLVEGGTWVFDSQTATGIPMVFVDGQNIVVRTTVIQLRQGNAAILVAGCSGFDVTSTIFTCVAPTGNRSASASNPPAIRIEAAASSVISGLNSSIYTGAGSSMVGVSSCGVNAATASDGNGLYSAINGIAGTTAPVSGTYNASIIVSGNAANALPGNGVTAANWAVMTVIGNQFNLTNGVPAGISWSPSTPPAGASQVVAYNAPQAFQPVSLVNGWLTYQSRTLSYTLLPDGLVHLSGQIQVPSGVGNPSTVCTLPAAYWPSRPEPVPAVNVGTSGQPFVTYVEIGTSGNIQVFGGPGAGSTIRFQGSFPLSV